jgi:hypothetical protein
VTDRGRLFAPEREPEARRAVAAAPDDLLEELRGRGASIVGGWREGPRGYLHAEAGPEALFARYSLRPDDRAVLRHEADVRALVGSEGPLRAPPILARGTSWLLERAVPAGPVRGAAAVGVILEAGRRLAVLDLPRGPSARRRERGRIRRRLRTLASPLPARDVVLARRLAGTIRLPEVPSHGDFHPRNVLMDGGAAWVVDWEHSGMRPLGFDLLRMWANLADDADRRQLFEGAVALSGPEHRAGLVRLRYVMAVRATANKLAAPGRFRDPAGAGVLLPLLPELRREALRSPGG